MPKKFTIYILPQKFGICHFSPKTPFPNWLLKLDFFSFTKTDQEISILCPQDKIPPGVFYEKDWRGFRIEGIIEGLYQYGIIEQFAKPLARNKISIFNISTFQTDYIFFEEKNLKKVIKILSKFCKIKR